ncbi:MAG: hypothetical protein CMJ40_04600 [Phycisphaerae bacterium]|nr:hypothetical protein [Phycisphaerae bacterium]
MAEIQKPASWTDEFNVPTPEALRKELVEESTETFDQLRKLMNGFDGVTEDCRWYGDCWHWSLTYLLDEQPFREPSDEWDPLALIIPAPEDVQLAISMTPEFASSINTRRLKRGVRDGLELGSPPFTTRWAVWSIPTPGLLPELAGLIKQKIAWLRTH